MNLTLRVILTASALMLSTVLSAQITLYESDGFRGRVYSTRQQVSNFETIGFNDRASSVIVDRGRWEVCEDARFSGRCMVLNRGSYDSLNAMGMNDRISSARRVAETRQYDNEAFGQLNSTTYQYRRRPNERIYEAPVMSVRAVVESAGQRCWIERQRVGNSERDEPNIGGAIIGGILGGVLGHQVGGGRGNDLATALGAIGGGAIGVNTGRDNNRSYGRNVRRCESDTSGTPAYWDVTYEYRGVEHRLQMNNPPGSTIAVNRNGEPRQ